MNMDITPQQMEATLPNVIVVAPREGVASLKDLLRKGRSEPGFMYGSSGNGSASHFSGEKCRIAAGLQVQHVPYHGTPEALNDEMGGRVDWFLLPDVPTTNERGLVGADHLFWVGMFAPAKTPATAIARLHAETVNALKSDGARPHLEKPGTEPAPMPQQQFATFVRDKTVATAALSKQAGLRFDG